MKKTYVLLTILLLSTSLFAQVPKTVIVEHFTNTLCSVCASRNPSFYQVLDKHKDVLHIAYHPSSPYPACIFNQHNKTENDNRTKYYGIYGSTPKVILNGARVPAANPMISESQLNTEKSKMSDYSIQIMQEAVDMNTRKASFVVKREQGTGSQNLLLRVVIVEKLIKYDAPNGEKEHHDVFRKKLDTYKIDIQNAGDSLVFSTNFNLDNEWIRDEVYLIATLENETSKEIVQANASNMVQTSSITDTWHSEHTISPNPGKGRLHFSNAVVKDFEKIEIFNLMGAKMLSSNLEFSYMDLNLENGYYFIRFISASGLQQHTEKILIQK